MEQNRNNDAMSGLMEQGREIVDKANQRHVIVRKADGTKLVDVTASVFALVVVAIVVFQPIGTLAAVGAIIYGIANKLKIEVVHELVEDDDVVEVNIPQD